MNLSSEKLTRHDWLESPKYFPVLDSLTTEEQAAILRWLFHRFVQNVKDDQIKELLHVFFVDWAFYNDNHRH